MYSCRKFPYAAPVRKILSQTLRSQWRKEAVSILRTRACCRWLNTHSVLVEAESPLLPISVDEFKNALEQRDELDTILEQTSHVAGRNPQLLGLAISGGLDSSCLAYLAKSLEVRYPNRYSFRAFIVDHKARQGSTDEAYAVRDSLQQRGLPTSVLELRWPPEQDPLKLPNFESEARKLRYRVLGRECHRFGIRHLLLAQHDDDQAETILGRISNGYVGRGLAAMAPRANIPESHGIYGVHNLPRSGLGPDIGYAEKGIQIHRPFLNFSKERLRMTCEEHGVNWVEDKTNDDRTLTPRNAVRYILESGKLPAALRKRSLLNLGRVIRRRVRMFQTNGTTVLRGMQISNIDLRSGTLNFSFSDSFIKIMRTYDNKVEPLAAALTRIAESLSPFEVIEHAKMVELARKYLLDASILAPNAMEENGKKKLSSFTLVGLFWQKNATKDEGRTIWTVSREPHSSLNPRGPWDIAPWREPCCIWIKSAGPREVNDPTETSIAPFGAWQLYDGRFWIRLWNSKYQSLVVRPLESSDLAMIRKQVGSKVLYQVRKLDRRLKKGAPGKIRWTLPAVAEPSTGGVLALPTMNLRLVSGDKDPVKWEVQYKHTQLADWRPNASRGYRKWNPAMEEKISGE